MATADLYQRSVAVKDWDKPCLTDIASDFCFFEAKLIKTIPKRHQDEQRFVEGEDDGLLSSDWDVGGSKDLKCLTKGPTGAHGSYLCKYFPAKCFTKTEESLLQLT